MLDEESLSLEEFYWSFDQSQWHPIAIRLYIETGLSHSPLVLDERRAKVIQGYLSEGREHFISLRHLHRALNEDDPRYRWIEATTAAELAIKEFLIKFVPDIQALLLEVPSPPLTKLYGSVLESYTGTRSPKVKQLQKGIEIRNKLVHRPEEIKMSKQESIDYVKDVETAIFHLLKLLYPNDPIVEDNVNPRYRMQTSIRVHSSAASN
jgi:hypothetical protein